MRFLYFVAVPMLLTACGSDQPEQLESGLPVLNTDPFSLTVSGISSGGYMAHHFHLAHADRVHGAAIISAGPYDCAQGSLGTALSQCLGQPEQQPSATHQLNLALQRSEQRELAPLGQVQQHQVWLFRGQQDSTVGPDVFDSLVELYEGLVAPDNLHVVTDVDTHHLFPTLDYGTECNVSEPPYIGACGYDAAGELLKALYGTVHEPSSEAQGQLISFNQKEAGGHFAETLADEAYIYVPPDCADGRACSVHISFHGCNQNSEAIGDAYARHSGLNRWADSNRLVILYPQVAASKVMPMNPQACWDWWGYTDEKYATNEGQQIEAVLNIVRRVSGVTLEEF